MVLNELHFYIQLLFRTYYTTAEMPSDVHVGLRVKLPLLLSDFNQNYSMSTHCSTVPEYQISWKSFWRFSICYVRTDREASRGIFATFRCERIKITSYVVPLDGITGVHKYVCSHQLCVSYLPRDQTWYAVPIGLHCMAQHTHRKYDKYIYIFCWKIWKEEIIWKTRA
jgi:hypothetical protein